MRWALFPFFRRHGAVPPSRRRRRGSNRRRRRSHVRPVDVQPAASWPQRAGSSQLRLASLAFLAATMLLTIDNLLAFTGGVIIGVALRQWIIPIAQDWLDARELAARFHRRTKRGR